MVFFRFVFLSHFSRFHHKDRVVKLTCKQIKYNKNSVAGNELVSEFGPCGDSFVLFVCSLVFYCGLGEWLFSLFNVSISVINNFFPWFLVDSWFKIRQSLNLRRTVSHLLHPILELTSFLIKTPKLLQVSVIIIIIIIIIIIYYYYIVIICRVHSGKIAFCERVPRVLNCFDASGLYLIHLSPFFYRLKRR